jgi:O-antigen ligase
MPGMSMVMRPSIIWIFSLGGLFLLLAPLSTSGENSGVANAAKYVRLFVSILIIFIGFAAARPNQVRGVSAWYLSFVVFYFFGATWSSDPAWGLFHKGMLLATCGAGLMMAHCLHTLAELQRGLRIIGLIAAFAGVWVFMQYVRNPNESVVFNRLAVASINANSLGQGAACLLIFALYGSLSERRYFWRVLGLGSSALLIWVVVATGSRGAVLFAGIGILSLVYLHIKKRFVGVIILLGVVFIALNTVLLFSNDLDQENAFVVEEGPQLGFTRLSEELTKNTRDGIWRAGMKRFYSAPIIGIGWANFKGRSITFMNVYLQVLLETGLVGAFFFLLVLLNILGKLLKGCRMPFDMDYAQCHFLAVGLVGALLVHGLAESSTLLGTTPNALLIGFALGLIDRLPYMNVPMLGPYGPPPGPGPY